MSHLNEIQGNVPVLTSDVNTMTQLFDSFVCPGVASFMCFSSNAQEVLVCFLVISKRAFRTFTVERTQRYQKPKQS